MKNNTINCYFSKKFCNNFVSETKKIKEFSENDKENNEDRDIFNLIKDKNELKIKIKKLENEIKLINNEKEEILIEKKKLNDNILDCNKEIKNMKDLCQKNNEKAVQFEKNYLDIVEKYGIIQENHQNSHNKLIKYENNLRNCEETLMIISKSMSNFFYKNDKNVEIYSKRNFGENLSFCSKIQNFSWDLEKQGKEIIQSLEFFFEDYFVRKKNL